MTVDQKTLLLFDFQSHNWTELAKGSLGFMNWSKDGKYIYVWDNSRTPAILKIRISDRKERAVELKDFVVRSRNSEPLIPEILSRSAQAASDEYSAGGPARARSLA